MGLFTNNKKLCPICGNPTPRLLASAVEGQNLCKECAAKIDLPDGVLNSMTLDEFREYINCYDANKPLRDSFTETYRYDFGLFWRTARYCTKEKRGTSGAARVISRNV